MKYSKNQIEEFLIKNKEFINDDLFIKIDYLASHMGLPRDVVLKQLVKLGYIDKSKDSVK